MPRITLNGEACEAEPGQTIIQVADAVGVQIPRYCYHPDIGIEGSCRMCLVEAEGVPKLIPSCATPVREGLVVRSDTERVQEAVRYAMEFLLLHHPIDCPVCDQSGECWLQDYYMEHGGHDSRYPLGQKERRRKAFDLGPRVKLDEERCILCTRCVRFTENVTGTSEIQVFGRGHHSTIGVYKDRPLDNPYSINVVDVCPVGALTSTDFRFKVRSWFLKGTPSICGGCSTGCNLRVDHSARPLGGGVPGYSATDGTIYRSVGRRNPEVNRSWLCDEGRLSFHRLEEGQRLEKARSQGKVKPIGEILVEVHDRFEAMRGQHGDNALAALGSATSTNEALYLMKTYFRGRVDFRLGDEASTYQETEDDLLRRMDKHPNTRGALDLGFASVFEGLADVEARVGAGEIRALWLAFHPQLVGHDPPELLERVKKLLSTVEYSVVSTTHLSDWADAASVLLPMAAWSEETGTYTNYAGRVQIANRVVMPLGEVRPLYQLMGDLVRRTGMAAADRPDQIFEMLASDLGKYSGLDYETIGPMGSAATGNPVEPQGVVG